MMIAVIGSGTMGKGIAIEFARNNRDVLLISAERCLSIHELRQEIKKIAEVNEMANIEEILLKITTTNDFTNLHQCELIIEATAEDLQKKRKVIEKMSEHVSPSSIIASNTSSLSISDIFDGLVDLNKVIGLHFFNPVQVMRLVEISYLDNTSSNTLEYAKQLVNSINKEYVIVKNSPGFIVNRLLIPMINEAAKIVDEGIATPADIDKAMKFGANHPIGPLKLSDLIGNDITLSILKVLQDASYNIMISDSLEGLVTEKKLGRKTKEGFYSYTEK